MGRQATNLRRLGTNTWTLDQEELSQRALEVWSLSTLGLNYDKKKLSPCGTFCPPGKRTMATPELTIEHLAKILRTSPLIQGWITMTRRQSVPTPSCHHCGRTAGCHRDNLLSGNVITSSIGTQSSVSIHYCGRHCHRGEQHHPQQRTARGISCKNILPNNNKIFLATITKYSYQQ